MRRGFVRNFDETNHLARIRFVSEPFIRYADNGCNFHRTMSTVSRMKMCLRRLRVKWECDDGTRTRMYARKRYLVQCPSGLPRAVSARATGVFDRLSLRVPTRYNVTPDDTRMSENNRGHRRLMRPNSRLPSSLPRSSNGLSLMYTWIKEEVTAHFPSSRQRRLTKVKKLRHATPR